MTINSQTVLERTIQSSSLSSSPTSALEHYDPTAPLAEPAQAFAQDQLEQACEYQ